MRRVVAAAILLVACKAPTEKRPVTIDVQFRIAGAPPEYLHDAIGGPLGAALENPEHGRHVRVVEQLGVVDLEVTFDREVPATAYGIVKQIAEIETHTDGSIQGVVAEAPTLVIGSYDTPPDVVVTIAGPAVVDARSAAARADILPVLQHAAGVARVLVRGPEPAHWAIAVDRERLRAHQLTVVDVVAAIRARASSTPVVATPGALETVVVGPDANTVKLAAVATFAAVAGRGDGPVELAVWLGPDGTPKAVDDALATAAPAFTAKGLVVTTGRAPGHSAPKPNEVELSIIPEGASTAGGWGRITADLTSAHLVGKLVQQPPGASPRAYSLALDLPDAGRYHLAALTGFVRAANGEPLITVGDRPLLLGATPDLDSVQLAGPDGGSVPLSWAVKHDVLDPIINLSGRRAYVFRTKLPAGITLAQLTAYLAKRSDFAQIATVQATAVTR